MANSFDVNLVLDRVSKRTITYLGNRFAPLAAFATDFSDEEYTQGQNVRFQVANAGPTVQTNPTNWESGNWGLTNVNCVVNQYAASLSLTPRQLNNEFRLDQAIDIGLQQIGNQFIDNAFAPLTTANFTNYTLASANFSQANIANLLATAWVATAKCATKNAILDAASYAKLLPTQLNTELGPRSGLAGMDALFLNTRWNGATANVFGFVGGPGAVAHIAGLPESVPSMFGEAIQQQVITVPLGGRGTLNQGESPPSVRLLQTTWLATATRTMWISYDWMQGAAFTGDTAAGVLFKTA